VLETNIVVVDNHVPQQRRISLPDPSSFPRARRRRHDANNLRSRPYKEREVVHQTFTHAFIAQCETCILSLFFGIAFRAFQALWVFGAFCVCFFMS
jgi:hypothetical protein